MIHITDKTQCCGCTACANICAHHAITMEPDAMGFLYPIVDENKCVECDLCDKVCAFNDHYDCSLNLQQPFAYAVRHKDLKEVETSRSGAVFIAISDYVLEKGGVIYGVGYADHFRVIHKRAITSKERDEFKGSKYVQSDLDSIFRQVKEDLKNGLLVMFSGTPCQTAGLNSYIGSRLRSSLILVDIVCHGVPGPFLWRDYLSYLERKEGNRICYVNFRDKERYGWSAHKETFKFENNNKKVSFPFLFYQNIMFRRSCEVCPYANLRRPSDITIGDFWGWERIDLSINADNKGVSLVLVNTEKGKLLFDSIKDCMKAIPAKLKDCLQPNLQHPSEAHPKRIVFEKDYERNGFVYVLKHYFKDSRFVCFKRIVKKLYGYIHEILLSFK